MDGTGSRASGAPLLVLERVSKKFGGVTALDGVDFELRSGEIHALLGENGAGKSTLIKLLAGIHLPDAGTIRLKGEEVFIRGVADADRLGMRVIHQELSLAPNLSVAENIYLGREPTRLGLLDRKKMCDDAQALVDALELGEIRDVRRTVSELSLAHQQLVEIARALSSEATILILDEPTSSLSEAETQALFATLRRLRNQGVGIIYISHRLEEILQLTDRVTVLRDGRSMGTQQTAEINQRQLIEWMVGRAIKDHFPRAAARAGAVALSVRNLVAPGVRGVSFELRYGEVLGFAGLVGSGRTELARAIYGIDKVQAGQIWLDDKLVRIRKPREALRAGIVLVPEDRKQQGLVMGHSVAFNAALPWVQLWITGCLVRRRARDAIVNRLLENFRVRLADREQPIQQLSGGNQQKILLGRWMERPPKALILDEPTRGVDVGAREDMYRSIGALVERGMAVMLISSDLEEVLGISHRIAMYSDGRILDVVDAGTIGSEQIMRRLTGASVQ